MRAFITGSRAYGTPRPASDTDMVVFVSPSAEATLVSQLADGRAVNGGTNDSGGPDTGSIGVRVGQLNLIIVSDPAWYAAWRRGTDELVRQRPVTRDVAVAVFAPMFEAVKEERRRLGSDDRLHAQAIRKLLADWPQPPELAHLPAVADWLEENGYPLYAGGFRLWSRHIDAEGLL